MPFGHFEHCVYALSGSQEAQVKWQPTCSRNAATECAGTFESETLRRANPRARNRKGPPPLLQAKSRGSTKRHSFSWTTSDPRNARAVAVTSKRVVVAFNTVEVSSRTRQSSRSNSAV